VTDANLFGAPGIVGLIDGSGVEQCRGQHVLAGIPYFVISGNLVRLNRTIVESGDIFSTTVLGSIEGTERVFMSDNGIQLCITAPPGQETAGKSYIFTESPDTLLEITDVNFDGPASSNVYIDGYFVFHKSDGKKFFNSPLNNGLTGYDALDFNVAEADPDQIRGLGVINNQLAVFGSETIQWFRNIGRAPSPFAPITSSNVDVGVTEAQTIKQFSGGLAFVGAGTNESPAVWIVAGGQKKKISTIAIENELSKIDDTSNIFSWNYAEAGAYWYGITVSGTSYVYDLVNGRWHERQSIEGDSMSRYRISGAISAYNKILVGDLQTGNVGELSRSEYLQYGILTPMFAVSRPFDNTGNAVNVAAIEAFVDSGGGLPNDITISTGETATGKPIKGVGGSDPQITLSWSDDGGRTFKGLLSRSMGKIGEYEVRPTWPRLGRFPRERVLKFEVSSPTKATLIKVEADIV
jgi:hypothetical protein